MERDPSYGLPDAERAPDEENPSGPLGEITPDDEDTSGGPLSSGAGPGRGRGEPDVAGGADEGADEGAVGGGGERFEG